MSDIVIPLGDEAATRQLGEDLALVAAGGDCIALSGDLGAGKSTLARAFIRALANDDLLEVPSPTFTLVQAYEARIPVSHFDLYRIADPAEIDELGLDEALSSGIALVEWPERGGSALPDGHPAIRLDMDGNGRLATISGPPRFMERLDRVMALRAFLDTRGYKGARRRFLTGDSSFRAYERVVMPDGSRYVLMDSPARPNGPVIRDGKPYSQLVHLAEDVRPFIAVGRYLTSVGLSAPLIHEIDIPAGILLTEDLGSDGVLDAEGRPIAERYMQSVECLTAFHRLTPPSRLPVAGDEVHDVPAFDRVTLSYEVELLLDWHIPWKRDGAAATEAERAEYLAIWGELLDRVDRAEKHLVLRDYHSPNILWLGERAGNDRVGIIDFQDAIIGPTSYDVVSLAQDARVTVERPLMQALIDRYMALRTASGPFDREAFLESFAIMSAQRACRLNGLWVRLLRRDGLPGYMRHMPRTLWHLAMALEHPVNARLKDWIERAGILPPGLVAGDRPW